MNINKESVDGFYVWLIDDCLRDGDRIRTRNAECFRLFCVKETFNDTPLVGARRTAWKNALREWEWFMSGSNQIADLHPAVRPWWEPWANPYGHVPHNYSKQFRHWNGPFDQIANLIDGIQHHPYSRRHVVTTWNADAMAHPDCPITNCHGTVIQVFVRPDDSLHLYTYQRSVDVICGLPHNLIAYWAFLLWLAHRTSKKVGSLIWEGGDVHVYAEHAELAGRIVDTWGDCKPTPQLVYTPTSSDFLASDFALDGQYQPVFSEKARMIV